MAKYALVIGIAQYDHFANLPKAATDAEAIAHLLEQHHYTVIRLPRKLVAENQWAIAPNQKLTVADLSGELRLFLSDRADKQEALIYFAGHGFRIVNPITDEQEGYLAASDSARDGKNAVRIEDLNALLGRADLSSLMLLLDCCYAGSLIEQQALLHSTQTTVSRKQNYCLIAACRDFERAREGAEHGVFTAAVLKGLTADSASRGEVTSTDLFSFISRELRPSGQEAIFAGMGRAIPIVSYSSALWGQPNVGVNETPLNQKDTLLSAETHEPTSRQGQAEISHSTTGLTLGKRRRLEQERETLQGEWDLRSEKVRRLKADLAIETSTTVRFQLEQQLLYEDNKLSELGNEIDKIELALQ